MKTNYWNLFVLLLLLSVPGFIFELLPQDETIVNKFLIAYIVIGIFVVPPFTVGVYRYMIEGKKKNDYRISDIFYPFKNDYLNVVQIMFIMNLYIFMWSLLFLIPGIIKGIEYRFIPYLLAEDTSLTKNEVFYATKKQTSGNKFDIFILDLSFVGWYILGSFFFGIGVIFVVPYHYATNVELFIELKRQVS